MTLGEIRAIIPASELTLVEWIADRSPTEADACRACIIVGDDHGDPETIPFWEYDGEIPWAHCPDWTPPADDKDAKISRLEATVAALESRLRRAKS